MSWKLPSRSPSCPFAAAALSLACTLPAMASGSQDAARAAKPAAAAKEAAAADPMDTLRQKLAERLGAQKPADPRAANVMRVDNRATAPVPPAGASTSAAGSLTLSSGAARTNAKPAAARRVEPAHEPRTVPHGDHWDYSGEAGPQAWGKMKPEFSKCSTGQRQSPIDIRDGIAVQLEPIQFDYRTTGFSVIDNGHTVQVNLPSGNTITVLGRRFELLQFHFHRPSEERINGKQYDMVAHLVHQDAEGKLAVVAVLLDRGVAQPLVQAVWNALPLEKNEAQAAPGTIDLNKLLPEDRRYYTYMGSLTTPPCSEGVLWMVMKTPVPVSPEQIDIFARLYPMNARPVQQAAGRLIKESN
ncbi:MAG TPA: carbonic anhydrase family protein [Ideonella sp.]|uniref:carbonic anhydrase n=1 Tax=Ideonella sp. TaxID=1929293 RepID=UPI002E2F2196|nr:carbonic anhydrase family protein [Ideonella sp.]HEX5685737.1 carbonic anhydrase family protein [Ideonella sp.]